MLFPEGCEIVLTREVPMFEGTTSDNKQIFVGWCGCTRDYGAYTSDGAKWWEGKGPVLPVYKNTTNVVYDIAKNHQEIRESCVRNEIYVGDCLYGYLFSDSNQFMNNSNPFLSRMEISNTNYHITDPHLSMIDLVYANHDLNDENDRVAKCIGTIYTDPETNAVTVKISIESYFDVLYEHTNKNN